MSWQGEPCPPALQLFEALTAQTRSIRRYQVPHTDEQIQYQIGC